MQIQTESLKLILQSRDEVESMIEAMTASERAQVSPDWLIGVRAAEEPSPWVFPFRVVNSETNAVVGSCSFKGPPLDGIVEIAYAIETEYEGNGFATEAARALVEFASGSGEVYLVRAHTLPEAPASKRVLAKCGFKYVGETIDPEDGAVSRLEK